MSLTSARGGIAAIIENLLKRKWSMSILAYLEQGLDPAEIVKREPELSAHVLSERLRSMLRYRIVARYPQPSPSNVIHYRLTPLGRKILEILHMIEELDRRFLNREQATSEQGVSRADSPSSLVQLDANETNITKAAG